MKLLLVISALLFSFSAHAVGEKNFQIKYHDKENDRAVKLLKRIAKKHISDKQEIFNSPLLNFFVSPKNPKQSQNVSVFIQTDTTFTGRTISLDLDLNGVPQGSVQHPSSNLWVLPMGVLKEIKPYAIGATVFIENKQDNLDLRAAIKDLDGNINTLTRQINAARDPVQRKILQEQREEKIALKTELLEQLKKYRIKVGTQNFAFNLETNPSNPSLPSITQAAPSVGKPGGGTLVTISGANFSSNVSVRFGGIEATSVTYVDAQTIQAVTPNFNNQLGAKDIELRFTENGKITNVILPSGFFVTNVVEGQNQKPVAIANASAKVDLGNPVQLDGSSSYDPNGDGFDFEWHFSSVPPSSAFIIGQTLPNQAQNIFLPDVHGTFVLELRVRENSTAERLLSEASLAVIEVNGAPLPSADPIQVGEGKAATTQIIANNPNPGHTIFYSIATTPLRGVASVSNSGLVTYTANDFTANSQDSFNVKVLDSSGLFAILNIPVSISHSNHAPTASAPGIPLFSGETKTSQMVVVDVDNPNYGDTFTYSIASNPSHGTASVSSSGLITYTAASPYSSSEDTFVARVMDNGGLSADVTISVAIVPNHAPAPTANGFSVGINGSRTTQVLANDPDSNQTVIFAITTAPSFGTATISSSGLVSYTNTSGVAGNDSLTVTVSDNLGLTGSVQIPISIVTALPPVINTPYFFFTTQGAPISTTLTSFGVSDPNVGGSITSCYWIFGDGTSDHAALLTNCYTIHDYMLPGLYQATVVVTNNFGVSTSANVQVNIQDRFIPAPRAKVDQVSGPIPFAVTFDASSSLMGAGSTVFRYRFLWGDGSAELFNGTNPIATHTYNTAGTYQVRIVLEENESRAVGIVFTKVYAGVSAPATGSPPVPVFRIMPRQAILGAAQTFDASASFDINPASTMTNYAWGFQDWGICQDGCLGSGVTTSYTYSDANSHITNLKVTNSLGGSVTSGYFNSNVVNLGFAPRAAWKVNNTYNFTGITGVAPYTLTGDGSRSYDYDGSVVSYSWRFGDWSACPVDSCSATGQTASYTYTVPGVYFPSLTVTDNDGNKHGLTKGLTVNPSKNVKILDIGDGSEVTEFNNLVNACGANIGSACNSLAEIYAQRGDTFSANELYKRACNLGYQEACGHIGSKR